MSSTPSTGNGDHALSRREFVQALIAAPALVGLAGKTDRAIAGGFVDDGSAVGHAIRDRSTFPTARDRKRVSVAIIGAGIGGLTTGWKLDALGIRDWTLLEASGDTGGNSRSGRNSVSRFPWGAHYLPVPSPDAHHVRALMRELGVLTDGGWDERTLCHSPQERIFQHGRWHEGLEPFDAMSTTARQQFDRFESRIAEWRESGAFTVPSAPGHVRGRAGRDSRRLAALDATTAAEWMKGEGFTAPQLRWWVEYGTRDDYGLSLEHASAWAAVHYFAGRAPDDIGPLVWPEGNDWIATRLAARAGDRLLTGAPAVHIERSGVRWLVRTPRIDVECDVLVWASPLFVLPYVLPSIRLPAQLEYAPWVVANITLDRQPESRGVELAWDNVIYDSPSLGYVNATHQSLGTPTPANVWTWYHAVVGREPRDARALLQRQSWAQWRDFILADLGRAHRDIASCVTRIDIMRWGHAMARPTPGLLGRTETLRNWQPAARLLIAHADLSGLSLFEEAQWHGVHAAEQAATILQR